MLIWLRVSEWVSEWVMMWCESTLKKQLRFWLLADIMKVIYNVLVIHQHSLTHTRTHTTRNCSQELAPSRSHTHTLTQLTQSLTAGPNWQSAVLLAPKVRPCPFLKRQPMEQSWFCTDKASQKSDDSWQSPDRSSNVLDSNIVSGGIGRYILATFFSLFIPSKR